MEQGGVVHGGCVAFRHVLLLKLVGDGAALVHHGQVVEYSAYFPIYPAPPVRIRRVVRVVIIRHDVELKDVGRVALAVLEDVGRLRRRSRESVRLEGGQREGHLLGTQAVQVVLVIPYLYRNDEAFFEVVVVANVDVGVLARHGEVDVFHAEVVGIFAVALLHLGVEEVVAVHEILMHLVNVHLGTGYDVLDRPGVHAGVGLVRRIGEREHGVLDGGGAIRRALGVVNLNLEREDLSDVVFDRPVGKHLLIAILPEGLGDRDLMALRRVGGLYLKEIRTFRMINNFKLIAFRHFCFFYTVLYSLDSCICTYLGLVLLKTCPGVGVCAVAVIRRSCGLKRLIIACIFRALIVSHGSTVSLQRQA